MKTFRLAVKDKGRTVLPAGLRQACGFSPGDALRARPIGPGQFIVETDEAVLTRIWSRLPEPHEASDGVDELSRWRMTSEAARRDLLENPEMTTEAESVRRGTSLLDELGL